MSGTTKDRIIDELYRVLELLHAPTYILATVGSHGDTLTDEEILEALQSWPSEKPEVLFAVPGVKWWGDEHQPVPDPWPNTTYQQPSDFGRPVMTLKLTSIDKKPALVDDKPGTFKMWSHASDESGGEPVAVIEFEDGYPTSIPVNRFRFTDRGNHAKP